MKNVLKTLLDIEECDTDIVDVYVECLQSDEAHSSPESKLTDTVESLYSTSLPAKKSRSSKQVSLIWKKEIPSINLLNRIISWVCLWKEH